MRFTSHYIMPLVIHSLGGGHTCACMCVHTHTRTHTHTNMHTDILQRINVKKTSFSAIKDWCAWLKMTKTTNFMTEMHTNMLYRNKHLYTALEIQALIYYMPIHSILNYCNKLFLSTLATSTVRKQFYAFQSCVFY